MSFPNVWHHRRVADTAAKSCDVCYRPSANVLVTPEKQDFFYVCLAHLKDPRFATPVVDQAAVAAKKKMEAEEEIERVKKEYEEKQRKKKEKEAEKQKEKEQGKEKEQEKEKEKSKDDDEDKKKDGEPNEAEGDKAKGEAKPDDKEKSVAAAKAEEEGPRVFALHKTFYEGRVARKRKIEMAKRNRERLADPTFFPSVPKGAPGPPGS